MSVDSIFEKSDKNADTILTGPAIAFDWLDGFAFLFAYQWYLVNTDHQLLRAFDSLLFQTKSEC